jgi:hypothetical protein
MSLFHTCQPILTCGDDGTQTTLVFSRATRGQNSAGEILLSFASAVTVAVDLQPEGGTYPRYLQGTLDQVNYTAIGFGNLDVRTGDRTTISGAAVEVINVQHWGLEQTELALSIVR